jgi:hypothetical protein
VSREHVDRFPGFDRDEFEKLSEDELRQMDEEIVVSCCPSEVVEKPASASRFDRWAHYKPPSWWDSSFDRPDRADVNARSMAGAEESRGQR